MRNRFDINHWIIHCTVHIIMIDRKLFWIVKDFDYFQQRKYEKCHWLKLQFENMLCWYLNSKLHIFGFGEMAMQNSTFKARGQTENTCSVNSAIKVKSQSISPSLFLPLRKLSVWALQHALNREVGAGISRHGFHMKKLLNEEKHSALLTKAALGCCGLLIM